MPENDSVRVETDTRTCHAGRVILCAGSWMRHLTKELGLDLPLSVSIGLNGYFRPHDPAIFMPDRFPVFIHHFSDPNLLAGGIPIFGQCGVKLIFDHIARDAGPDHSSAPVDSPHLHALRAYAQNILPGLGDEITTMDTCVYTFTPDADFIVDQHPLHPQITIASPCSGHGFKFGVLIGRILADLVARGTTEYNIAAFRLDRASLRGAI